MDFASRVGQLARRALLQLAPRKQWRRRAQRAARVLRSFQITLSSDGSWTGGIDVEALEGHADSGYLPDDLTDLVIALGDAAAEVESGVVFVFDEIQFLSVGELEALIAALHKSVQRQLPITLVGAGLPQLPRLAGEAKSYSERLFRFPVIGRLGEAEAYEALVEPARREGVEIEPAAARAVFELTDGYPYFIQEYGKSIWDVAEESPIGVEDVARAHDIVEAKLDESFFRVRLERATENELSYMRAMAALGPEPQRAKLVAESLDRTIEQLGPTRSRLVEKGLLYTPSRGLAAFTVPQFDRYLLRTQP
jgi:hypothetical protein